MSLYKGYITALITPFANGKVDLQAFETFVNWQIENGISGLVPCGTTGEGPTLTPAEMGDLFRATVSVRDGHKTDRYVPVIAGTGSNDTGYTIECTKIAEAAGADSALIVTPYYNRPTQEGVYQHFKAIHDATNLPIILYNVPGRTNVDLSVETTLRLAELPRIIGLKDATGEITRVKPIQDKVKDDFVLLCGDDYAAASYMKEGGHGCISVTSNVLPAECMALYKAIMANDDVTTDMLLSILNPWNKGLFIESSPTPVKYACHRLGFGRDDMRLPLIPATTETRVHIDELLKNLPEKQNNDAATSQIKNYG
jgi:4-hydroxy-tetrahydrodipicolinate synthase